VRKSTKSAVGVMSLGILGLSYQLGTAATASTGGFASPTDAATPLAQASESSTPEPSASESSATVAQGSSAGSETTNTAPKPAASASASSAPVASASPSASETQQATTNAASVSKTGDAVESGFGPVQVKVTKVSGKITEITYLQSVATHGRAAAFPYLVQYAIQANGSNFGNLSGATYTTNAFKRSLESALAKF